MTAVDDLRRWFRHQGLPFRSPADLVRNTARHVPDAVNDARIGMEMIARALDEIAPYDVGAICEELDEIVTEIRGARFIFDSEDTLQRGVALALEAAGFRVKREVRLGQHDRIDHLVGASSDTPIGIECKVASNPDSVRRQLERYADHEEVKALILVTNRARHQGLGNAVVGRASNRMIPLAVVYIGGQAL